MTNETSGCGSEAPAQQEQHEPRATAVPAADIYETETGFTLIADIPGADKASIDVQLERGTLTVRARSAFTSPAGAELLHGELRPIDWARTFTVNEDVDPDGIDASYGDGVLTIQLAKSRRAQARKVPVR